MARRLGGEVGHAPQQPGSRPSLRPALRACSLRLLLPE